MNTTFYPLVPPPIIRLKKWSIFIWEKNIRVTWFMAKYMQQLGTQYNLNADRWCLGSVRSRLNSKHIMIHKECKNQWPEAEVFSCFMWSVFRIRWNCNPLVPWANFHYIIAPKLICHISRLFFRFTVIFFLIPLPTVKPFMGKDKLKYNT